MARDKELEEIVFSYPKLTERVKDRKEAQDTVLKNLYEIRANFSPAAMKPVEKLMDFVVKKLYTGITFSTTDKLDFKKLVAENNVVLVPNHQSHADYVAINYKVYKTFKFPLYVAGGINLNIFPIGPLFRRCGCFFLRRSFTGDILYKLTFEAYLFYLLKTKKPIEFFFEGGRSRTGKLLPPRYGLYQMLLDAHKLIPESERAPMKFVPVSIVHEYVPEQKTLSKEMEGRKKQKESFMQLIKVFNIFTKQMGSVHIKLGRPVSPVELDDPKETTRKLAFNCFREVGRNLVITPSSLLALILLDEPSGALKMDMIIKKAENIVKFCNEFNIPITESLDLSNLAATMARSIDLFIANGKVNVIGRSRYGHVFYAIKEECRLEILYFKNSILHHFLVPWIINSAWIHIFSGDMTTVKELKDFIIKQRDLLKHEFYLPAAKEFLNLTMKIASSAAGRDIKNLEQCMNLSPRDLYLIVSKLGSFARGCSYIYEGHYLAALTIKSLTSDLQPEFTNSEFQKEFNEIFEIELAHGRVVKYIESRSAPLIKNSIKFLGYENIIKNEKGVFKVIDRERLEAFIKRYGKILSEQLTFNLRV